LQRREIDVGVYCVSHVKEAIRGPVIAIT
jgi:hypothetical protein